MTCTEKLDNMYKNKGKCLAFSILKIYFFSLNRQTGMGTILDSVILSVSETAQDDSAADISENHTTSVHLSGKCAGVSRGFSCFCSQITPSQRPIL